MTRTPSPEVLDVLRGAALSEDGLTLTLPGQLDRKLYQQTMKALDAYGGTWNRKLAAHIFPVPFTDQLEALLNGGVVQEKNPHAFFWTPPAVVDRMLRLVRMPLHAQLNVLEPSAGDGAIADILFSAHNLLPDCVELDPMRGAVLAMRGYPVIGGDFLALEPHAIYDLILMNPPFAVKGDPLAYITHIEHALKWLRPGGELVSVVPVGLDFRTDRRVTRFRDLVNASDGWLPLPDDAFKAAGTRVGTGLVHVERDRVTLD